jgi:hypothetical protein
MSLKWKLPLILICIFLIYLLFPSNNSSLDAYAYAADIKYDFSSLFRPHHLLYGPFYYILLLPARSLFPDLDILQALKILNACCALSGLYILYLIMKRLAINENTALLYMLLLAFSFGVWRFSTENEVYLVPVFFSLCASLFFLKTLITQKKKYLFYSGLFAAIACLFHQVHFFWWLGLLITVIFYFKKSKSLLLFSCSALIVPLAYLAVIVFQLKQPPTASHLLHYVFSDYYSGAATTGLGLKNIFFTAVGLWRSFLQLFPSMLLLLERNILYYIPLLLLAGFLFLFFKKIKSTGWDARLPLPEYTVFSRAHFLILILQFCFAAYSIGNAEFMVMIPYLAALLLALHLSVHRWVLPALTLTFITWNFMYGIFPAYHYKFSDSKEMVDYIKNHPHAAFVVKNNEIPNRYTYETGTDNYPGIYTRDRIDKTRVDSLLNQHIPVYTNLIDRPEIINRETFSESGDPNIWNHYRQTRIASFPSFYGAWSLFRIE